MKSKGELGFAGLLLALGVFILVDATTIEIPKAASNVGPRFFPYAVATLLTGRSGHGRRRHPARRPRRARRRVSWSTPPCR